jgi:hypothetical protein
MTPDYVDDFARALLRCGYRVTSAVIRPDGTGEIECARSLMRGDERVLGPRYYFGAHGEPVRKRTPVKVQREARRAAAVTALCRWLRP